MTTLSASAIVDQLHHAGLKISLAPAGGLGVAPSSHLTADLRDLVRSSKAMLIEWLMAANSAPSHVPDPPENRLGWKELAAAYYAHHFKCSICISAGQSGRQGSRCDIGKTLWKIYCQTQLHDSISASLNTHEN